MTEFSKTTLLVDKCGECLNKMRNEDVSPPAKKEAVNLFTETSKELEPKLEKMKKKAMEPDPDKRLYGDAMVKKVLALVERYDEMSTFFDSCMVVVEKELVPYEEEQKKQKEEEAAAATREAQRQREIERRLREEEEEIKEMERRAEQLRAEAREKRYREQCEEADRIRLENLRQVEEEKAQRAALLRSLNATPTRVLLRRGILTLFNHCKEGVIKPKTGVTWLRYFDDSIRNLHQFTKNLAGHPDSHSLKNLRFANQNFFSDILSRGEGAKYIVYSLGYRPAGFGDGAFLVLEEIDPQEKYEEWSEWWEHVKWTRDYLNDLIETMREHRRGFAKTEYVIDEYLPLVKDETMDLDQPDAPFYEEPEDQRYFS
eukprot:TRINITY_DN896_c6_g1_i2.p1 TRINITY_DN896_c6_g1~~TRINITY_DN896_c6_g1_i2.p1  ORF type:complete len:372 (+),score=101.71 TRINITY_DN896_c6_g1_i2:1050-2165(+)